MPNQPEYLTDEDIARWDAEHYLPNQNQPTLSDEEVAKFDASNQPEYLTDADIYKFDLEQKRQRGDVVDMIAGTTPKKLAEQGNWVASGLQQTAKDLFAIPANYLNQAALNAPRSLANTLGYTIPFEAQSPVANVLAKGAGVAGAITSAPLKAIGTLGKGVAGIASAPLRYKVAAGALTGAAYSPNDNILGLKERGKQAIVGAAVPLAVKATSQAIRSISKLPDKVFRGGLTRADALRVETEYGSSNGSLVQTIKDSLTRKIDEADSKYQQVFDNFGNGKAINIRPAIEEAGNRLKRLGLITESGNLTELGKSEISRDSVYGKLLDFYQSSDAISGVGKLANKESLTQGQMVKLMKAGRETYVNKDQFLFLRDKLNSLYKNKPSDIDVSKVVDRFYRCGEDSGLSGLQRARELEREAFRKSDMFLNRNTGDLKIATEKNLNRVGKLSQQEREHIQELERYIGKPIIKDADSINKLNEARNLLAKRKEQIKWAGIGGAAAALGIGGVNKFKNLGY